MKVSEIRNGNMNKIYLVEVDNHKYIIRTSDFNNEFECKVLELLKQHNYNCPQIITHFVLNGKYIMLYEYIDGDNPRQFDDTFFANLGKLLSKLHSIHADYDQSEYVMNEENTAKLSEYYDTAIKSRYLKNDISFIKKMYDGVIDINLDQFSKCIVHSDIKRENMLQNGQDLFLIDFGNCYMGSRLIDVIRVIMWFFIKDSNYDYNQIQMFIDSYFENHPLNNMERVHVSELLHYCILYNLLKDIALNEQGVLVDEYIENNSLNWLKELKNEEKIKKIGELFKNA